MHGIYGTIERLLVRNVLVLFQAERAMQKIVSAVPNVANGYLLAVYVVFTIEAIEIEFVDAYGQRVANIHRADRKRLTCLQKHASDFLLVSQDLL